MRLRAGARVGPYEVLAVLGAGGMGEVYRARDTRLGREVALKVISDGAALDPERLQRFEQEARLAGSLNHPNLVVVHDVGSEGGAPFLVTELLEGESLRHRLSRGRLPLRTALELGAQIAEGLAAAHARGVVHRDVKPENVFLTSGGRAKLLDFGIAKLTAPRAIEGTRNLLDTTLTPEGLGTTARRRARNTRVHVPRAGTWRPRGRPDGHLQPRHGALRDAGRRPRVPRQELDRERARHPRIRAPSPSGVGSPLGRSAGAAVPGEGASPALPVRGRPRLRPRGGHGPDLREGSADCSPELASLVARLALLGAALALVAVRP